MRPASRHLRKTLHPALFGQRAVKEQGSKIPNEPVAILLGTGGILMAESIGTTSAAGPDWLTSSPSEAGFTYDLEVLLETAITEKRAWNLHGVVVVRNGRLVFERYFEGNDNARGHPLGNVAFTAATLHDLRSVSKSIIGLLYGIAERCRHPMRRCLPHSPSTVISPPTPPGTVGLSETC